MQNKASLDFFGELHHCGKKILADIGGVAAKIATDLRFRKGDDGRDVEGGIDVYGIIRGYWRRQLLSYRTITFWGGFDNGSMNPNESKVVKCILVIKGRAVC